MVLADCDIFTIILTISFDIGPLDCLVAGPISSMSLVSYPAQRSGAKFIFFCIDIKEYVIRSNH